MTNSNQVYELLKYYQDVAYFLGLTEKAGELERINKNTTDYSGEQATHTLFWFYKLFYENMHSLNNLVLAFLGDKTKQNGINVEIAKITRKKGSFPTVEKAFIENEENELNRSQKKAIYQALHYPISFIQGPPGTGKTETILNIVSAILESSGKVAVISRNIAALDNIECKICKFREEEKKESKPNRDRLIKSFARLGNGIVRVNWAREIDDKHSDTKEKIICKNCNLRTIKKEWCHENATSGFSFKRKTRVSFEELGVSSLGNKTTSWERTIETEGLRGFLNKYPFITCTSHSIMKCFKDGYIKEKGAYQYDYIIIDEVSQCDVLAGIVAMNCAKKLILVGDKEQLPPVHENEELPNFPLNDVLRKTYEIFDGQSFLTACLNVFSKAPRTFLNVHYRCHPNIIGFCNDYVYNGKLDYIYNRKHVTETKRKGMNTPIKVLWYEGDYCEYREPESTPKDENVAKRSKRNMKQINIFMQEEWSYVCDIVKKNPQHSVCILSPFRGQLYELRDCVEKELKKSNSTGTVYTDLTNIAGESLVGKKEGNTEETIPAMLTIHKSQGQEFDLVYLLPVEDGNWEWPWSQGKNIINVAVSRAKKELRIIVSSCLMEPVTQMALIKDKKPVKPNKREGVGNNERKEELKRQKYVQKLVEYVRNSHVSSKMYGFHEAKYPSIFDDIPRYLKSRKPSAPERCLSAALNNMHIERIGLDYLFNVPLSKCFLSVDCNIKEKLSDDEYTVECSAPDEDKKMTIEEKIRFINEKESHFDFVIFNKKTKAIIMVIEVDGEYHRVRSKDDFNGEDLRKQQRRDQRKNSIAKDFGAIVRNGNKKENWKRNSKEPRYPAFILLRLPTDGTTYAEVNSLRDESKKNKSIYTIEDMIAQVQKYHKKQKSNRLFYLR